MNSSETTVILSSFLCPYQLKLKKEWRTIDSCFILLIAVTMQDALPLADQPQLLQPNARREELFGMPRQPVTVPASGDAPPGVNNPLEGGTAKLRSIRF